ncbi:hypothetical protein [Paenibacillus amylolyticus]
MVAGRQSGVLGPDRSSGEDPGLPDRVRGGRSAASGTCAYPGSGRHGSEG